MARGRRASKFLNVLLVPEVFFALALGRPAAASSSVAPQPSAARTVKAKPPRTEWLRDYSLSPYGEVWTLNLSVKNLEEGLPKVLDAVEAEQGALTAPFESFASSRTAKTQQLSLRLPKNSGEALLKKFSGLGRLDEPAKRPNDDIQYLPEIRSQIRRLKKERKSHPKSLAAMPDISAVIGQLIDRLSVFAAVYQSAQDQVLVNLTVRQAP